MSTPVETMLSQIQWRPMEAPTTTGVLPYATHEGILTIGDASLRVFQLSDGKRIIDADDMAEFFGVTAGELKAMTAMGVLDASR